MTSSLIAPLERDPLEQLSPQELSRLLEVSHGLGESLDLERVLAKVVEAARDVLDTEMSTILMPDPSGELLRIEASAGLDPDLARRLATPYGENLAGIAAATGMPVRSGDVVLDERCGFGGICDGHIRAAMLAPLSRNGKVLGVLGVETLEEREFSDRDEGILQLLADHAAAAIETARLYAVEHDQVERLQALLQRINSQNDAMRRSRDAHTRLAEAALEGSGLGALLGVLGDLVPAPIVLVNQFGTRLGADAALGDGRGEALWRECAGAGELDAALATLRTRPGPLHTAPGPKSAGWRLVPVAAAGEALGALVVLDHDCLEEGHVAILEEAATIVATELLRERSVAEAEARSHGDLMQALIASDVAGTGVCERAALLGHDLTAEQAVVVVVPAGDAVLPDPGAVVSAGRRAVARVGLRGLFGIVEDHAVALLAAGDRSLCRESVERWVRAFEEELGRRAEAVELRFGVCEVPCSGEAVCEGLAHARQAAAMCRLGNEGNLICFDDVQLIASLIDITNSEAIERYIERTIGRLEEYDGRKHAHLAQTLETYLDCSGVARHAAKALFLHPHSLRYRLRRISEIQGIDLEDPMARLSSHLALKLRAIVAPEA
ncbi:MAG TPA: GAF domain-containing protein [Solirubrobacterales bacterium]